MAYNALSSSKPQINTKGETTMVAQLFFPDFAKRHSPGYHRYLADVVELHTKVADPAFRMKTTIRHAENLCVNYSESFSQYWMGSLRTGIAFSVALERGTKAFWSSWFVGISQANLQFLKTLETARKVSTSEKASQPKIRSIAKG